MKSVMSDTDIDTPALLRQAQNWRKASATFTLGAKFKGMTNSS